MARRQRWGPRAPRPGAFELAEGLCRSGCASAMCILDYVDTYLNEFVFRYNRRFYRHVSFEALLGLATHHEPTGYWDIIKRDNPRKSAGRHQAPRLLHIRLT